MARRPTVIVIHNNERVPVLVPQASLTFKDFDGWVRSRFLFNHDDQLIFYDSVDKSKGTLDLVISSTKIHLPFFSHIRDNPWRFVGNIRR